MLKCARRASQTLEPFKVAGSLQGHKPHSWKLLLFSCSVVSDSLSAPGTVACQDPLSMGFPKEYWSGLPLPPPGYALHPRIEPKSPSWEVDSLLLRSPGKPFIKIPKHGLPFHPHSHRRVQWGFSRGYKLCDITTVWMQKQRGGSSWLLLCQTLKQSYSSHSFLLKKKVIKNNITYINMKLAYF